MSFSGLARMYHFVENTTRKATVVLQPFFDFLSCAELRVLLYNIMYARDFTGWDCPCPSRQRRE